MIQSAGFPINPFYLCHSVQMPNIIFHQNMFWSLFFPFLVGFEMSRGMTGRLSYQSETALMFGGSHPLAHQSSMTHFKIIYHVTHMTSELNFIRNQSVLF